MNAITGFEKQGTHKTEVVCNNTEDEGVLFQQEDLYNNRWKNKTLSHVLQAPGKPWGFGILLIALPTSKDNLFFPQKPFCWLPNWKEYLNGEMFYFLFDTPQQYIF